MPMIKEDPVTNDLAATSVDAYRDYFDEVGRVKNQEGLDCFLFFLNNVLCAVNAKLTKFGTSCNKERAKYFLSEVFSASDEAFALLLIKNYHHRWSKLLSQDTTYGGKSSRSKDLDAKYTSSNSGVKNQGYSEAGLLRFWELVQIVTDKRAANSTGRNFEQALKQYITTGTSVMGADASNEEDAPPLSCVMVQPPSIVLLQKAQRKAELEQATAAAAAAAAKNLFSV